MASSLLADLIDARLLELRRQGSATAKQVAVRAGIKETTLSMIRKGLRGVSQEVAVSIARALDLDPYRFQEVLTAAGYAPVSIGPSSRPVIINLLTMEGYTSSMQALTGDHKVWVFGPGILETTDDRFYDLFRMNYCRGIEYRFFIHPNNALDFVKLRDRLEQDVSERLDLNRCTALILPDVSFHHRSPKLFKCLCQSPDGHHQGFRSSCESDGTFLFAELAPEEVGDLRTFLGGIVSKANAGKAEAVYVGEWLQSKGYTVNL